ncbi:ADP-ribosylglycohydrolase family protein [Natronorubrum tibetense]|nr:ADP-ribosylglycohydrolase family protein [Natronorubrum tibetense]
MVQSDYATGILLGLACGDALGRPVEGWSSDHIEAEYGTLRDFAGYGAHDRPPGTVTDDTQLAMRLARSLVNCGGFDRDDFVTRLVEWYEEQPFGIGGTTTEALRRIRDGVPPEDASRRARETKPPGKKATNGSVMRCAPIAVPYATDREELQRVSRTSSRVTHCDPRCVHGCSVLNLTLAYILTGSDRPLQAALDDLPATAPQELRHHLDPVPDEIDPTDIVPANDAVETLRAALYHGLTASDAETAIVMAVNEGGDADTVGAVTGAIAGARFGVSDVPDRWVATVEYRTELEQLGEQLANLRSGHCEAGDDRNDRS